MYSTREIHEGTSLQEAALLVNLQKAAQGVPTATLDLQTTGSAWEENHCRQNRPLYVISTLDNTTLQFLDKVFEDPSSCYPRWLVFLDNASSLEASLRDVNIPFDCEFLVAQQGVRLSEVYRVSRTLPLQIFPWGSWSPGGGLQGPVLGLYSRRRDLQGIQLKAVAIHYPPDFTVRNGKMDGYIKDMFDVLGQKWNFSLAVSEPEDKYFGNQGDNGSWTGMLGCLQRGEADFSLNSFIQTSQRTTVAKISQPILIIRNHAYIREPHEADWSWSNYLTPFSGELWLAVLVSIFVLTGVIHLVQQAGRRYGNGTEDKCFLCSFWETLHYVAGIFCSQGHWNTPQPWSARLIYWISYVMAIVLWSAYAANLVAYLTVKPVPRLPFTSFEGLLQDGTYRFAVMKKSPYVDYFKSTTDPVLRELFSRYLQQNLDGLPGSILEAAQRVCSGKVVFLSNTELMDHVMSSLSCKIVPLPDAKYYSNGVGLALRRGSPYSNIILYGLEQLRHTGVLRRLSDVLRIKTKPQVDSPFASILLRQVAPMIVLLEVTTLAAIFIMMLRKVHRSYNKKNHSEDTNRY